MQGIPCKRNQKAYKIGLLYIQTCSDRYGDGSVETIIILLSIYWYQNTVITILIIYHYRWIIKAIR